MGILPTLIMYGVIAAALAAGYASWHHSIYAAGAKAQLEKDTLLYNACVTDKNTAIAANKSLQSDIEVIKVDIKDRNTEIDNMAKQLQRAREIRAKDKIIIEPINTGLINDKAAELAKAAIALGGTCEEKMKRITAGLTNLAKREMQDRPPTKEEAKGLLQIK